MPVGKTMHRKLLDHENAYASVYLCLLQIFVTNAYSGGAPGIYLSTKVTFLYSISVHSLEMCLLPRNNSTLLKTNFTTVAGLRAPLSRWLEGLKSALQILEWMVIADQFLAYNVCLIFSHYLASFWIFFRAIRFTDRWNKFMTTI